MGERRYDVGEGALHPRSVYGGGISSGGGLRDTGQSTGTSKYSSAVGCSLDAGSFTSGESERLVGGDGEAQKVGRGAEEIVVLAV